MKKSANVPIAIPLFTASIFYANISLSSISILYYQKGFHILTLHVALKLSFFVSLQSDCYPTT